MKNIVIDGFDVKRRCRRDSIEFDAWQNGELKASVTIEDESRIPDAEHFLRRKLGINWGMNPLGVVYSLKPTTGGIRLNRTHE